MPASQRVRPIPWGAELALSLGAGAAAFGVVAVVLEVLDAHVLVVLFAAGCVAAVVAIDRAWGIAYAVPAAMAALLAFDWYQFPPTHPFAVPGTGDLANLLVYLGVAVLIAELAAYATRRAEASEAARAASREQVARLADEQAALRRVATLVAQGVEPSAVFAAVAHEVGALLAVDATHIGRYEADGTSIGVGNWSRAGDHLPVGTRAPVTGDNVSARVLATGRPARLDRYGDDEDGAIARLLRTAGIRSSVGAPIVVDGRPLGRDGRVVEAGRAAAA